MPIPILVLVVSATKRLEVPAVFWIWKAVVEFAEPCILRPVANDVDIRPSL